MGLIAELAQSKQVPLGSPDDPTMLGEASKGFSRGLRTTGASLEQAGGLGAEALGFGGVGQTLRSGAQALRESAAAPQFAAEAPTWNDVGGVGQALRWGVGKAGEMAPIMGGAAVGTALSGGNPFVGGTLAMTPVGIGDIDERQQADPTIVGQSVGERSLRAAAGGLAGGALMSVPIGGALGRGIMSGGEKSLGRALVKNVGEGAVTGGVGMGGGEVINQLAANPNAPINTDQVGEAALGGAVAMGIGHVPAGVGSYLKGNGASIGNAVGSARQTINERVAAAKDKLSKPEAEPAAAEPGAKIPGAFDGIHAMIERGKQKFNDTVETIRNGGELGDQAKDIATATGDRVKELLDISDNERVKAVTKWGKEMLDDAGLSAEKRAEIADALSNAKDRAAQTAMAGYKTAFDAGKAAAGKISEFMDKLKEKSTKAEDLAPDDHAHPDGGWMQNDADIQAHSPKMSADYSGSHAAIRAALNETGLAERQPGLFENPQKAAEMVSGMRVMMDRMKSGRVSDDLLKGAVHMLGDDAASTFVALRKSLNMKLDTPQNEAFFSNVYRMKSVLENSNDLHDVMRRSLTEEALQNGADKNIQADAKALVDHARGFAGKERSSERAYFDKMVDEHFAKQYGAKADDVRAAVEKAAGLDKGRVGEDGVRIDEAGNEVTGVEGGFDETGNRIQVPETDKMYFGLSRADAKGNSKSEINGNAMLADSKYARQHLLDLKAKYPEKDVRFEKMHPGSDLGHIVVEERANPGEFSPADLAAMKHDTKKYPNSPSRLSVGGHEIDAVKVAKQMRNKMQDKFEREGTTTAAQRLVDGFKQGIAQLTEQFGQKIDVPDKAVIGYVGKDVKGDGKGQQVPLTWGEAKKLDVRTAGDKLRDGDARDIENLRAARKLARDERAAATTEEAKKAATDKIAALSTAIKEIEAAHESVLAAELGRGDDIQTSSSGENKMSRTREFRAAEQAKMTVEKPVGTTVMDHGIEKNPLESMKPDKEGNIHAAAAGLKENDLVHRSNMDGTGQWVSEHVSATEGKARNELTVTAIGWSKVEGVGTQGLVTRVKKLMANASSMSAVDKRSLLDLAGKTLGQAAPTINQLARKYASGIVAPGVKAPEPIKAKKGTVLEPATVVFDKNGNARRGAPATKGESHFAQFSAGELREQLVEVERKLTNPSTDSRSYLKELDGERMALKAELASRSAPNPKAVAAKKAAFLERAASGDKALTQELSASNDVKGLQRAVEAMQATHGSTEAFKAASERLETLVKGSEDVAYGLQTKKYSLESAKTEEPADGRAKLISRLADDRRDGFSNTSKTGVVSRKFREDSFGPLGREFTHYFAHDANSTHSFIIPNELVSRLSRELSSRPGDTAYHLKALAYFSAQHAFYDIKTGEFETFGPRAKTPGAELLAKLNALGDTGQRVSGGGEVTRVEGVPVRDTAKFLATALAYSKHIVGEDKIPVNWERTTGGNIGKKGEGMFSAEGTDPAAKNTQAFRDSVKAYIDSVLGPSVKLAWKDLTSMTHAGDYTHVDKLIRLSYHALNPMGTAFHESFHAFVAQLRDAGAHDITKVLEKAASSEHVIAQLKERFKNQPEVLKQLADPEERAAYMYQMWAGDPNFKVSIAATTAMGKIKQFIAKLMNVWTNDERALHIMKYFNEGDYKRDMSSPSAVRHALMETHRSQILETAKSFAEPLGKFADAVIGTGGDRLRDTGIPSLRRLADIMKRDHLTEGGDQGFIQASRVEGTKMRTALGELLHGYTEEQLHDAMEGLQAGKPALTPEARLAARDIKGFLKEAHEYMKAAGVNIGSLGPDYFPRVWDTHYISKNQQAFRDMLEPYIRSGEMKGTADQLISNLLSRGGTEIGIEARNLRETNQPGMQFGKERLLSFITPQDASQFVEKNLHATLSSYINQATRKAEWSRRLGGGKLETLLSEARAEGATKEHLALAEDYMKGVDGTLGDDLNPTARRLMGNMIVYQNVRLLPTAAFSMLIDPNGVLVRGGTIGDAWSTMKRGMKGITQTFNKEGGEAHDQATKWAELVGVVDSAMMSHAMGDVFSQGMVGGTASKINNAFFKYNLVEGLNRNFRIGATEAAMKFMGRHAGGLEGLGESTHSRRWMRELGLQKGDVQMTADGRIAMTQAEGLTPAQEQRVHAAINQWVDGAVLRPDAADKPVWMNDPHYALISHLKQFVFSFQKTILERTMHEMRAGNYTPMMALASYVPIMMAADMAKGVLVTGGGVPAWQAGWGPADYTEYAIERAGLFGVGQFGVDIAKDLHRGGTGIGALAGPTIEQLGDAVSTLGGRRQFSTTAIDAMPANTFVKGWGGVGESKADPVFAD